MLEDLHDLAPAFRPNLEAFIDFYQNRTIRDFRPHLAEDCLFEGALTAGRLRGREVVASHLRQTLQGPFAGSSLRCCGATGSGSAVELHWCAEALPPAEPKRVEGACRVEADEQGRIHYIRIAWDPRPFLRKPAKS